MSLDTCELKGEQKLPFPPLFSLSFFLSFSPPVSFLSLLLAGGRANSCCSSPPHKPVMIPREEEGQHEGADG